ncbi:MAG: lipoyl synthase [Planctomycetota bacterium]
MKIDLSSMVLDNASASGGGAGLEFIKRKKPDWLRAKLPSGPGFKETRNLVDKYKLHTVCESAKCPNLGECWERGTATMMILGDVCTRSCGFCHIKTGKPPEYDLDEPRRVGEAAAIMNLKHLVITSVNRDELPDGGAEIWAETIREIRRQSPGTQVEVLIPDFLGDWDALQIVLDERPEILNHNMESVKRLYKVVRPQAIYERSIELLRRAKAQGLTVKTGIMVGIGEREEEIEELMRDVTEGTRVTGVNHDVPTTNQDAFKVPDPYRVVPDASLRSASALHADTEKRSDEVSGIHPSGSLHDNIGTDKPGFDHKLRRGGELVDHANPYWDHHAPAKPQAADERIDEISYPNATYPGVHESCDILTIGQYLQPTRNHLPISHWVTPAQFVHYKQLAESIGFRHCESGPLVRSSYHADDQVLKMHEAGQTT